MLQPIRQASRATARRASRTAVGFIQHSGWSLAALVRDRHLGAVRGSSESSRATDFQVFVQVLAIPRQSFGVAALAQVAALTRATYTLVQLVRSSGARAHFPASLLRFDIGNRH